MSNLMARSDHFEATQSVKKDLKDWFAPVAWWWLGLGFILTGVLALSAHVVLLEVCKVPYPAALPRTGITYFLNYAVSVAALFVFCDLASQQVFTLRTWQRCLGLAVLLIMLGEVGRVFFIEGVITTAWRYSFVTHARDIFEPLALGTSVVLIAPWVRSWWLKTAAAGLITAVMLFAVRPLVSSVFGALLKSIEHLSHDSIYADTSWQLNTAAYLGYVEPTLASFTMAALVWPRLSVHPGWRAMQFALLLTLIRRTLFMAFYYPFYAPLSAPTAMLSAGQFTLEWLALGLLTAVTWQVSRRQAT